ncbi:hypothetical protein SSCG_00149 [Streptomyces clavuligerus]|nr:hypothetical protein SSCG_00149 [Streptomyces clavuligerus]
MRHGARLCGRPLSLLPGYRVSGQSRGRTEGWTSRSAARSHPLGGSGTRKVTEATSMERGANRSPSSPRLE